MDKKNIIFIGVVEAQKDKRTIYMIKDVLIKFKYKIIFSNKINNIICLKNHHNTIILINMNPKDINLYQLIGIEFNILIHNFIREKDYKEGLLKDQFTQCEYYILNSDDDCWTRLPLSSLDGVVINYGFHNKATLTISSYDINEIIKANICLQRSITSIFDKKIEPFEFVVELKSKNKDDIYPILAATLLNLILYNNDEPIESYKTIKIL